MSVKKFNDSTESNRPTPETDSETNYCDAIPDMPWVDVEVARKLERERDEARNQRDILRLDAQKEAEHHDRMVGELEKVYAERDEAREKLRMASIEANARQEIANALKERDEYKQERDEAREMLQQYMFDRSGAWIDFLPADKPAP